MKKIYIYGIIFLVIIILFFAFVKKPIKVMADNVRYGNLTDNISFSGTIYCKQLKTIYFPFEEGQIDSMISSNKMVKKGEVLYKISCEPIKNKYLIAKNNLDIAKTELNSAMIMYQNKEHLFKEHLISKSDFELIKNQLNIAKKKLRIAQLNFNNVQYLYDKLSEKSEFDGYVLNIYKNTGEYIHKGEPIISYGSLNTLYVKSYINEYNRNKLHLGQKCEITFDYLPHSYQGKIVQLSNIKILSQSGHKYLIEIKILNPNSNILVDSNCNVNIKLKTYKNIYYFPEEAVFSVKNKNFYYGIKGHTAYKTPLENFKNVKGFIILDKCIYKRVIINPTDLNNYPNKMYIKEQKEIELKGLF